MPEQIQKIVQPLRTKWDALTREQRIKLIAASSIVLAALILTIYLTARTQYVTYVENLPASEVMTIQAALDSEGIKNRTNRDASAIKVDKKRMADAKLAISANPDMQGMRFTFNDMLDRSGMSATERTKQVMLVQAKQTELAQALERLNYVDAATVTLNIPESIGISLFMPDGNKATAGAVITPNQTVTKEQGLAMARFIMRSIEGMELDNIEIIDNRANTIFSGTAESDINGTNNQAELREKENLKIINDVTRLFSPMYDLVQVVPSLQYNGDINKRIEEKLEYKVPEGMVERGIATHTISSNSQMKNTPAEFEPGVGSNNQQTPTYSMGQNTESSASSKDLEEKLVVDTIKTVTEEGPASASFVDSTMTVYLYKYKHYYQEKMQQNNRSFTQADWDDLVNNTETIVTVESPNITAHKASAFGATSIPLESIILHEIEIPLFHEYMKTPLDPQFLIMMTVLALLILMLAYGLIRRTKLEEDEDLEPELSVEDLLVSTQLEEAKEEEAAKYEEIDYFKESEVKKQIEKFVNEKPEAVASLLRTWLNAEE